MHCMKEFVCVTSTMSTSPLQKPREWKPLEQRKCTDIPWLLLFILFNVGMLCICGFAIATGAASRLISGYDSYGNTCGQKNGKIPGIELSGRDHTSRKYVFFLDPCNIDVLGRKIKSVALCVSKCPDTELKTYEDLRNFSAVYGSDLCSYDVQPDTYSSHSNRATKCPTLPVHPSASLPVFHRCMPVDISCYARFAEAFITFVSDNSVVHRVIAGVMTSKEIIMGLCLLFAFYFISVNVFISSIKMLLLFHILLYELPNGKISLLCRYVILNNGAPQVILLLLLFFMRKRVALTIALFHVAGKVFTHLPLLALQPFWTFLTLMLFWVYWITVLLFLGSAGSPVQNNQTGLVEFRMDGPLQYMVWYHAVGLVWISEFILACQQMTVAGAVVTYYFTRDKSQMPFTPIVSSVLRLMRYHLGTVVKGAFIITLVEIPRLILTYIHSQLKGRENACARCMLKACICCLWCLEKCLAYLNMNAYTATAINSTNFCTSARDAFFILVENALRVAAINSVGDFVLFLGKVLIVSCTAFAGILSLNYQREYTVWVLPLIIVCVFSFLVAHCFLSIFEIVVDVLFLCFAIDTKYNDGSPGREYYMDKALMVRQFPIHFR
uniref:Choline transporter-like protein n=1 Tax=Sinocyclocheilus rhinocerous TaxID=307959 RepID=A0A673I256_9TELE